MNKTRTDESDIDTLLQQVLADDLSAEAEIRMHRRLLSFRRSVEQYEGRSASGVLRADSRPRPRGQWVPWRLRKEALAFSSAVMMVAGCMMHLGGYHGVLADSISRLKVMVAVSEQLSRATSMDCSIRTPVAGGGILHHRVRWAQPGKTRVDVEEAGQTGKTLWIVDGKAVIADYAAGSLSTVASIAQLQDPLLPPALAFLSPAALAQRMGEKHQLKQAVRQDGTGPNAFLFAGKDDREVIEIGIDERTYLPTSLRRFQPDSIPGGQERSLLLEAQFTWNQPIAQELFNPSIPSRR
jgi:hypothetical protein